MLIIQTDEHNFRTLGCYRDQLSDDQAFMWGKDNIVETPNIDFLANNGILFTKYYAAMPETLHPKINNSPFLDDIGHRKFRSIIGCAN